jgi:hypothetical protein
MQHRNAAFVQLPRVKRAGRCRVDFPVFSGDAKQDFALQFGAQQGRSRLALASMWG